MKEILSIPSPYNRIKDLPQLNTRFLDLYNEILDKELEPVKIHIKEAKDRVIDELEKTGLVDKFGSKYKASFYDLKKRAEDCNNVAMVNGFRMEADILKMRYLEEIANELERQKQEVTEDNGDIIATKEPLIKRKNISIRDINPSNSWRVESKEDLDKYLEKLKDRLEKELEENTILNIEF